jgi:4-hydroxy-tetrahydrodipicolinate reductase
VATRVVVAGVGGRMGREIVAAAEGDGSIEVVGGTVRSGSTPGSVPVARVAADPTELLRDADVLVDFTTPESTLAHARAAAEAKRALVVGTTGLAPAAVDELRAIGRAVPVLYSRNMSVGVNALLGLLPGLVKALDGYDLEIWEHHHRGKKDAPSGTALALAEAMVADLGNRAVYGRQGIAPRQPGDVGIHAIRGGGNAGEHTILFADDGEQIQVIHRAYGRRTFALGALRAAKWVAGQPAGFYGMADLLNG